MKLVTGHKKSGRTRLVINQCLLDDKGLLVVANEAHRKYVLFILQSEYGMSEIDARIKMATFWEVFSGMRVTDQNLYIDDLDDALRSVTSCKGVVKVASLHTTSLTNLSITSKERNHEDHTQRKSQDRDEVEQRPTVGDVRHTGLEKSQKDEGNETSEATRNEPATVASST